MIKKITFLVGLAIILCKQTIFLVLGDQAVIGTWDSWDSLTLWPRLLIDRSLVFAPLGSAVPGFMGDLPRVSLGSELNLIILLNAIFPPFTAHAINAMIIALVGFIGMYLLLKEHFISETSLYWLVILIATAFGLFPFYPVAGISQSSIPIVIHSIINIHNKIKSRWQDWAVISLVPFYSSLLFSYLFFLIIVFALAIKSTIVKKKIPKFVLPAILMLALFLLVEYRFVVSLFAKTFISHRSEFSSMDAGIFEMIKAAGFVLLFGGNAPGVSAFVNHLIPLACIALLVLWCWRKDKRTIKRISPILFLIGTISLLHGVWNTAPVNMLKERFDFVNMFNFTRFTWLLTPILFILMAFACQRILNSNRNKRLATIIVASVACAQCAMLVPFTHDILVQTTLGGPTFTYRSFISGTSFREIEARITDMTGMQKDEYVVGSLGMEPIIAAVNGFNTVDGYANNYPLEYKHRFRNIIAAELEKDDDLRAYFDEWGNRCYLFSSEIGTAMQTRENNNSISNLAFNTTAMAEMGCKFVFSAVEIENHAALGWTHLFTTEHETSAWIIRVYLIF